MKRFLWLSMLLILLLSACSSSSSGVECKEEICISIEVEGPVQALEPILFVISIKTQKDVNNLGISLYGGRNITIQDIGKKPDVAELTYKNEYSMDWMIDTKGEQEYNFSGHIVLAKPTASIGIYSYGLIAAAGHPSITRVTDSVTIYLDAEGKQVEESRVKMELETDFPAPTRPPYLTVVPETPFPTIVWPTATPLPSPTLPAYP